jgi:hypothetical protein
MDDVPRAFLYDAYANGDAVNFNLTATANSGNDAREATLSRLLNNRAFGDGDPCLALVPSRILAIR